MDEILKKIITESKFINNPVVTYDQFVCQLLESVGDDKKDREIYLQNLKTIKDWAMFKYDDEKTPYAEKHYLYGVVKEINRLISIVDIT